MSSLNPSQLDIYQKMLSNPMYDGSPKFLSVGNLKQIQKKGLVKINLSSSICKTATINVTRSEYVDETNYLWAGHNDSVEDSTACDYAIFSLISSDGRKNGTLRLGEEQFLISDIGGLQVLNKLKYIEGLKTCDRVASTKSSNFNEDVATSRTSDCPNIKLLILYTKKVKNATEGDIKDKIKGYYESIKTGLFNSTFNTFDLNLILVGYEQIAFKETDKQVQADLAKLMKEPDVLYYQKQYKADLVMIITNPLVEGTTASSTREPTSVGYSNITYWGADATKAFEHEFGHLLHAGHQDDTRNGEPHAYEVKKNLTYVYNGDPKCYIPYYSTPGATYKGKKVGVFGKSNNANVMKSKSCLISNFVQDDPDKGVLTVTFGGVSSACPCGYVDLASAAGGVYIAPLSYNWEKSDDGINWSSFSNATKIYTAVSCTDGQITFLRLTVTDAGVGNAKQTAIAYGKIQATKYLCFKPLNPSSNSDFEAIVRANDYHIMTIEATENTTMNYQLISADGFVVAAQKESLARGKNTISLYTGDLATGVYILVIDKNGEHIVKKLFINN